MIIENIIKSNKKLYTYVNPYTYLIAKKNEGIYKEFNIWSDGILITKIFNLFGYKIERKSFDISSMAPLIFENAIKENKKIYIIGTKPELISKAIGNIKKLFPNLNIIGYRDGYINKEEYNKVLINIKKLNPDIVICGMGAPLQEKFLYDLKNIGWNGIGYTCGGFLHQIAKKTIYYPDWVNRYHLRWLYRICDEPKLLKRYLFYYPLGILVLLKDLFIYKFYKKKS